MPMKPSPEALERIRAAQTSAELNTEVTKVLDGLFAGTIAPEEGKALTEAVKAVLRAQLARLEDAKARRDAPTLSFFDFMQERRRAAK